MTYGALLPDVNELWAAARLEENGALSLRSADDRAEEAYWRHVISGFSRHAPDRYSREILDAALAVMRPYAPRTLLEIGPGWGNYTLDFAERMDKVTCVDISGDVLDFIQDAGRRAGLENIRTVHEKWEAFQPEEKADVVFGFNCFYRMPDLKEALRKVNDAAKTLCVVGMTSGPEQPYYRDFAQEMGLNVRFDRQDYIHLQLALYQLGIDPNVRTVPLVYALSFRHGGAIAGTR